MKKGKFIVFEGLDGSGKTLQAKMLVDYLNNKGIESEFTFEPTNSEIGKTLRSHIRKEKVLDKHTIALLFAADRTNHLYGKDGIISKLNKGINIVCDRYYYSNYVYQIVDGLCIDDLKNFNTYAIKPDITIYIDIDAYECLKRLSTEDIYESKELMVKVRQQYRYMLDMVNINGSNDIDTVHKEIVQTLIEKFSLIIKN